MSKLVAIMSMSLDGFVADSNDGVGEVFDWYMNSGDVEIPHRRVGPHDVQGVRAERRAPSRSLVRTWCRAHRSTHVRRRPRLGEITLGDQHSYLPTTSPPDGRDPTRLSTS